MKYFTSTNPCTDQIMERYAAFDLSGLDGVLETSVSAGQYWQDVAYPQRGEKLQALAQQLRSSVDELARLATLEMGKTLASSKAEVEKCAWVCDYYAENGADHLQDVQVATDNTSSYIHYQPLGVLLAIMPWNFPYWQVFRFLAPALMAGNSVVLKHASNVPGCALAIEKTVEAAGLPAGLFRTLLVGSAEAEKLIAHPIVQGVTFTGSTAAGKKIAAAAAGNIKKTVLELGGSDPYLILADANLEQTVETCVASRLINNGQSCIAAKRFIVHTSVYDEFTQGMARLMDAKKIGDPMDQACDIGPLARPDLCDLVAQQVQASLAAGAELVCGGVREGNFYHPTVLAGVSPGMAAFDEEIFGPVAAVIRAQSDEHAVALANQSEFGLGAAVFTEDRAKGEAIARNGLQAGACFVNTFVASDPRLPFGGVKASGYGRELGELGIREFTNQKTVVVK